MIGSGPGIKQFVTPTEREDFEMRINKTLSQKIFNTSQHIDQREASIGKIADESVANLTQAARKRSTDLNMGLAQLSRDAGKVKNLIKTAEELQQDVASIKETLQKLGQRFYDEATEVPVQLISAPDKVSGERPKTAKQAFTSKVQRK